MKTVWKYPLTGPGTIVTARKDAIPLHVSYDPGGSTCVWLELDEAEDIATYEFIIVGTGHEVPEGAFYLGTIIQNIFVWHVYWRVLS